MIIQKYLVILSLILITDAQEPDDNDGKYHPDAIPVWENERQDYTFSYGVKDLNTGDVKNQWEKKVGDTVQGQYTVLEPDGSLRIVHYTADEKNGFNAVVKHEGPSYHPVTVSSNHNHVHHQTPKPPTKPPKPKLPPKQHKPQQVPIHEFEDTQSVNIEPEMEAINAYLYIPSQHQESDHKVNQYELISDDQFHFVNYDSTSNHKNHKPVYTDIQPNIKVKTLQHNRPVSYDLLTPVTIDLNKFDLVNYQQQFDEPQIETGFRPLPKKKEPAQISNTFTTNKKPIATPGLKTYASDQRSHQRGPVTFPKRMDKSRIQQYTNQNRSFKGRNSGLRYTKHVTYV